MALLCSMHDSVTHGAKKTKTNNTIHFTGMNCLPDSTSTYVASNII